MSELKRTLQFNNSASEMFSFDVNVTAFSSSGSGVTGVTPDGTSGSPSGSSTSGSSLLSVTKVMRITVNPLTKVVTAKLL
jgi:hypothetical protein